MLRSGTFVLLCLLALVAACGEPEATPDSQGPEVAAIVVDVAGASTEELTAAAEVVRARLAALDLQVGEVGWDESAIEVIVPVADESLVRAALEPAGVVEFRPVLAAMGATATGTTPPAERTTEVQVTASDLDGGTYVLGPAGLTGDAIESAEAAESPSGVWSVTPVLREGADGIEAFNSLAAACFAAAPTCPSMSPGGRGMLAVLFDGIVLMAPSINVDRFERDQIQISGDLDETGARSLAAVLAGGVADVTWTVAD